MKNILILLFFFSISAFSHVGKFVVPMENQELASFLKFEIDDVEISPDHLRFTMPPELASDEAYSVKFERNSDGVNTLNSFFGSAHCLQETNQHIRCKIKFNTLYKDVLIKSLWKTMYYIQSNSSGVDELTSRLLVAEWFAGNPTGVLLIDIDTL
jgi:hypothetical protein